MFTYLIKSREISSIQNIRFSCRIVFQFYTEHGKHGSITAVLFMKVRNDKINYQLIMGELDFTRFGFKVNFGYSILNSPLLINQYQNDRTTVTSNFEASGIR